MKSFLFLDKEKFLKYILKIYQILIVEINAIKRI